MHQISIMHKGIFGVQACKGDQSRAVRHTEMNLGQDPTSMDA